MKTNRVKGFAAVKQNLVYHLVPSNIFFHHDDLHKLMTEHERHLTINRKKNKDLASTQHLLIARCINKRK